MRPPAGSVAVDLGGAPRAAPTWRLVLDGQVRDTRAPRLRLRGLEDGPHEVVVDVPGSLPRRYRFVVKDGGEVRLAPRLTPAPPR